MKKYMLVTPEALTKLGKCFSDSEEVATFISQMDDVTDELSFNKSMRQRMKSDQAAIILLKQVCIFALFCREHMELVQQLVHELECKEITEEEVKEIKEE